MVRTRLNITCDRCGYRNTVYGAGLDAGLDYRIPMGWGYLCLGDGVKHYCKKCMEESERIEGIYQSLMKSWNERKASALTLDYLERWIGGIVCNTKSQK